MKLLALLLESDSVSRYNTDVYFCSVAINMYEEVIKTISNYMSFQSSALLKYCRLCSSVDDGSNVWIQRCSPSINPHSSWSNVTCQSNDIVEYWPSDFNSSIPVDNVAGSHIINNSIDAILGSSLVSSAPFIFQLLKHFVDALQTLLYGTEPFINNFIGDRLELWI